MSVRLAISERTAEHLNSVIVSSDDVYVERSENV